MSGWRDCRLLDRRLLDRLGIAAPIVQAPMAGSGGPALAIGALEGGALGSLPCATIPPERIRADVAAVREAARGPINLNFFCHTLPDPATLDDAAWREALAPYYAQFDVGPPVERPAPRRPFDAALCTLVEEIRPEAVSFHFGLPEQALLERVRATGALILSTATSLAEARWLEARGVDAIIAQGWEAGGHSGRFLPADPASYMGGLALIPQMADAVSVPIVAAGGIADARGIAAALLLGASAVQMGTAYLACPESLIAPLHRRLLASELAERTVPTTVFTGRPARALPNRLVAEQGPVHPAAPPFPHAGDALVELRRVDPAGFASMWAGQAAGLTRPEPARALTQRLAREALALLAG